MADDKRTKIGPTGPARVVQPNDAAAKLVTEVLAQSGSAPPMPAIDPSTSYLPPAAPQVDPLIGQTLAGRYQIVRKLGEGGMGAVYLATHQLLEKQVALKVLHQEFARKPDLIERFIQEAKAASRIRHENVIDISDFGATPEGYVFFAMELLDGHDLHDEISRARLAGQLLPYARSKKIFLQICAALSAAHARGIVHRDLKPENVYLVEFLGDPDFVKLLDFGIAKLTEVSEEGRKLTRTGMLFGTPEYMSPEQARGEHVDLRVDVYAMGCILFQLLTGRVPFEADNFMGVLSLHLTEPPPVIPDAVFERIGAPRAIAAVIDKALAKSKDERYQTIDELANAVRIASGDPAVEAGGRTTGSVQAMREPSVPAPPITKEPRTPTPPPETRQRTQWTGSLQVPIADADPGPKPPPRPKLALILGGIAIAGVAAGGVWFATRGGGGGHEPPVGSASGSAPGSAPPPVTIDAAVAPLPAPLPEWAEVELDSVPRGAQVTDLATGTRFKTPKKLKVRGSNAPRQFQFSLRGYVDAIVDIVPNEPTIRHVEQLDRGSGVVTRPRPSDGSAGSGSATAAIPVRPRPGVGSGSGSAVVTPREPPPVVIDAGVRVRVPPVDDCDDPPCIKTNIPGLHGCTKDEDCATGQSCVDGACK